MEPLKTAPLLTPLRRIANPKGDVLHGMKRSDQGFAGFGEAYFSLIHPGQTKGWKKHLRMQLNLVVPHGDVRIIVVDERKPSTWTYVIGESNHARLTVPPGLWVAFCGMGVMTSVLLNIANLEHEDSEAVTCGLSEFPFLQTP